MAKNRPPAFQFYPKDWLSDLNVRRMNFEARGVYIDLIALTWIEDRVPSDVAELAAILQTTNEVVERVYSDIERCFKKDRKKGFWKHPRLEREKSVMQIRRKERSEAGKKGAKKKWENKELDGSAIKEPMAKNNSSSSSSSSTSSNSDDNDSNARGSPDDFLLQTAQGWLIKPDWKPKSETQAIAIRAGVPDSVFNDPKILDAFRLKYGDAPSRDQAFDKRYVDWCVREHRNKPTPGQAPVAGGGQHESFRERDRRERHAGLDALTEDFVNKKSWADQ